jgi:WD40 repeat protein
MGVSSSREHKEAMKKAYKEATDEYVSRVRSLSTKFHIFLNNISETPNHLVQTDVRILNVVSMGEHTDLVAIGNEEHNITFWHLNDLSNFIPQTEHNLQMAVWCVNPLPQNDLIISTSWNSDIYQVCNYKSGELLYSLSMKNHKICGGRRNLIPFGDKYVITGHNDDTTRITSYISDNGEGELLLSLKAHTDWVLCIELLPKGQLATGSRDQSIKVWDVISGEVLYTLTGHTNSIVSLCLVEDHYLASGSFDADVRLWNLRTKECTVLKGHTLGVQQICALGWNMFASAGEDGTVRIWSVLTKTCIKVLHDENESAVYRGLILVPHLGKLVAGAQSGIISVWDIGIPSIPASWMRNRLFGATTGQHFVDVSIHIS